jgi:hypothetical protein
MQFPSDLLPYSFPGIKFSVTTLAVLMAHYPEFLAEK